jgi:hypothetical protein
MAAGTIDFANDGFAVMLVDERYVADKDHRTVGDINGEVRDAVGYANQPARVTVNADAQRNRVEIVLGEAEWLRATIRAAGAIYHKTDGRLVAFIDFGGNVASTNGQFLLTPSVLRLQN